MGYRKATIYVYSGTGNSRRVARWLADVAVDAGAEVAFGPIESARPTHEVGHGEEALLALVLPTHGFTAPWAVLRFALRLPRRTRTHAVVVATRGGLKIGRLYTPGFEGTATSLPALILAAKGYRIRGTVGIDMPSNWTALHPSLPPQAVDSIIDRARARTARFGNSILSGKRRFVNRVESLLGLPTIPVSLGYLLVGRVFLAKLFFASGNCTSCGLCAKHCPNEAIEMRGDPDAGRPYWTTDCETCMRCMAYCPTQAVEASHLLAVAAYAVGRVVPTAAALAWLAARLPPLALLRHVPWGISFWATTLAALTLAYPVVHLLMQIRPLRWLFTHATLTHLYRRYNEPATTLQDLDRRERWTSKG